MANLFTEKTYDEAMRPLINYEGDDAYVKGDIYSMLNGGDLYDYARNYNVYKNALEDAKANDNDNFWSGIGDFFVGKSAERQKADLADEYLKAYQSNPFMFDSGSYNNAAGGIKTDADLDRGTFINGGLLGALINPLTQTAKAGVDLASGVGGSIGGDEHAWDAWNKRDHWSDLGALANTALTFTGLGNLARTAPLASKIAAGAAMGGAQNAAFNLWQNGSDAQIGDVLGDAAFGAAIGGAIPVAGNAIGNIAQRGAVKNVNNALRKSGFGSNLGDAGMYAAGQNVLGDQYQALLKQSNSGICNKLTNFATGALPNSRLGKMAAIGGGTALGGYGLSKLFGGNNTQQMINDIKLGGEYLSDEDLAALYNYYGIGG